MHPLRDGDGASPEGDATMQVTQLIYTSRPFGFEADILDDILVSARRHNRRNAITGALICRADVYMQILEGPRAAVTATFGRILSDDRHVDVALVYCGDSEARLFPKWDMRDDPPRSWMWTQAEVSAGAVRNASTAQIREIFVRLAAEAATAEP
jgi:hypothetical protein